MKKSWLIIILLAFFIGITAHYIPRFTQETQTSMSGIFNPDDPRIRIVYFGFTRCPDVCPTSLAMLGAAMKSLDPNIIKTIRPIFISLDPERDKPEDVIEYAHYFNDNIEGYSLPLNTLSRLTQRYGVIFQKTELEQSELKYTIDHTSYFYFLTPDGNLIQKIPHTTTPQPIIDAIKQGYIS